MSRLGSKKSHSGGKKWVHPPDVLLNGHIVYSVKFLGSVEVEQAKGTDVVKDAIRKMKFNKQIKKAEGQKPPKVELTISVDGVTIQEPKHKIIQHQYPLHRISYCADDKSDKRMLTFIGKDAERDTHQCFVFDSDKCAEEITLTIGQAFDLAYKRFLEKSSKDLDLRKQFLVLQKKVQTLTQENLGLKAKCADLERMLDPDVLKKYNESMGNSNNVSNENIDMNGSRDSVEVGRRLENLVFDDIKPHVTTSSNGSSSLSSLSSNSVNSNTVPALSPPPPVPSRSNVSSTPITFSTSENGVDMFGQKPFNSEIGSANRPAPATGTSQPLSPTNPFVQPQNDPFGMVQFVPSTPTSGDLDRQISAADRELLDLQAGFTRGLSFGTSDFSLDDLDPLKN